MRVTASNKNNESRDTKPFCHRVTINVHTLTHVHKMYQEGIINVNRKKSKKKINKKKVIIKASKKTVNNKTSCRVLRTPDLPAGPLRIISSAKPIRRPRMRSISTAPAYSTSRVMSVNVARGQ